MWGEGEFNAQGVKVKVKGRSEWAASQREKGGVDYWSYVRLERTRETFPRDIWLINYQPNTGMLIFFRKWNHIHQNYNWEAIKIQNCLFTRTHNSKIANPDRRKHDITIWLLFWCPYSTHPTTLFLLHLIEGCRQSKSKTTRWIFGFLRILWFFLDFSAKSFHLLEVEKGGTIWVDLDDDISSRCLFAWWDTFQHSSRQIVKKGKIRNTWSFLFVSSSPETTICCGLAPVPSKVPSKVPPENFSLEEVGSWSEMRTSTFSVLLPHFPRRLKISTLWTFTRFP